MNFEFSRVLKYILISPSAFLMLVAAVGAWTGLTWKQIAEHRTDWVETTASLEKVAVETRDSKPEYYTRATYCFVANSQKISSFSYEAFPTNELAEDRARLIREYKQKTFVFYDRKNPNFSTFLLDDVQMSWPQYFMIITILISLAAYSLWIIKIRHEHYGADYFSD